MRHKIPAFILLSVLWVTGCVLSPAGMPLVAQPLTLTPTYTPVNAVIAGSCADPLKVVNAFYDANDASQINTSVAYLTEDVIFVFWAEGINGHHMGQKVVIGKDYVRGELSGPGLHRVAAQPDQANFKLENVHQIGNQVTFNLTPDRTHQDGRPYDPYVVEFIFSGCRIDIIRVVERITWV